MISPEGVMPAELLHKGRRRAVIEWLRQQPLRSYDKAALLRGWAAFVGERITAAEYREVEATGIER